jgi:hypothetical protein
MRWVIIFSVLLLFISSPYSAYCGEKTLTLPDLGRCRIIGTLGKPLGTVVRIDGAAVDDGYRRLKSDEGETLLKIEKVDGRKPAGEVIIRLMPSALASITCPKTGQRFSLIGYETGGFTGIPGEAFKYIPQAATAGFQFETHFEALKDCLK